MALNLKHVLCFSLICSTPAWASPNFTPEKLESFDFAQMQEATTTETKRCYKSAMGTQNEPLEVGNGEELDSSGIRQTAELRSCLKDVVAMILARRQQNDAVQRDLVKRTLFEIQENFRTQTLKEIAQETIEKYKHSEDNKKAQSVAYEQMKNLLSELKSRLGTEKADVKPIIQMVKNADLEVDSKLQSLRANGPGGISPNLSEKAEEILQNIGEGA